MSYVASIMNLTFSE